MSSFWHHLPKPFFALAPMEDVTDTVFRRIICDCGRPDVLFTEFTNCEGMQSAGQAKVIHRLKYDPSERPLVAQVWGVTPEDYFKTASLIQELGFDGIDINMGCPVKKVIKMGACSALIKKPSLAKEIIQATKAGAPDLPVSVKTRIGFSQIQTEEWLGFLLDQAQPDVLTVHGRTVKEESEVPCHWEEVAKAVILRNQLMQNDSSRKMTLIVGNGDITSLEEAQTKAHLYNLDGIMIGRGVFKNPWIFNPAVSINSLGEAINTNTQQILGKTERLKILQKHIILWQDTWGNTKNFAILKKYFKIYLSGYALSSQDRAELMETTNTDQALKMIDATLTKTDN